MRQPRSGALTLHLLGILALVLSACGGGAAPTPAGSASAITQSSAGPSSLAATSSSAAPGSSSAAASKAPSGEPVKIGLSAPFTGDNAVSGEKGMKGAKLAVDRINASGGILGRPVTVVQGDDRCDPKEGATVAQKFASEKIQAVVGHYCSGAALAALPIFKSSNILYYDWDANASKIAQYGYDKFFAGTYIGGQAGVKTAQVAINDLKGKKLAVVDDRTPANGEFADAFEATAKSMGANVVLHEHVTQGEKDFSAFVTKLQGTGADLLYCSLYYSESALLLRQMRQQKLTAIFLGAEPIIDPKFVEIAGQDTAEGALAVAPPLATDLSSDAAREYAAAWEKAYGEKPGVIGYTAYDGINVIAAAYNAVGKLDNDAAAKWLHGITKGNALKGVYANLYWNKDGTLGEVTLIPYQVKGGQFVAFKTS